jgi:hypothetical protein
VATARELLEQADALMRKNRGRLDTDIPLLTDAIETTPAQFGVPTAGIPVLTDRVEAAAVTAPQLVTRPAAVASVFEGDPSDWLVMDTIDPALHSITGESPDTLAVVPPVTLRVPDPVSIPEAPSEEPPVEFDAPARATHKAAGSAPTPPPEMSNAPEPEPLPPPARDIPLPLPPPEIAPPPVMEAEVMEIPPPPVMEAEVMEIPPPPVIEAEVITAAPPPAITERAADSLAATTSDERWRALAEQISMQVLQRIDLFTDTGLKEQLARHLQPIVDRASAELVGEINDQVGKLVRSYVAEAIEREIVQWRSDHR